MFKEGRLLTFHSWWGLILGYRQKVITYLDSVLIPFIRHLVTTVTKLVTDRLVIPNFTVHEARHYH